MASSLRTAGRNARVTRLGTAAVERLISVAGSSFLAELADSLIDRLSHSWKTSATTTGARHGFAKSDSFVRGSWFIGIFYDFAGPLTEALDEAAVTDLGRWTEAAVRASWLYRWLTTEPEPEVIVIDLRQTVSIGPVIAAIDQLVRWLVPASHRSAVIGAGEWCSRSVSAAPVLAASLLVGVAVSTELGIALAMGDPTRSGIVARGVLLGLAVLGTRIRMTFDELVETRPIRLFLSVLEPPEPPNSSDE